MRPRRYVLEMRRRMRAGTEHDWSYWNEYDTKAEAAEGAERPRNWKPTHLTVLEVRVRDRKKPAA